MQPFFFLQTINFYFTLHFHCFNINGFNNNVIKNVCSIFQMQRKKIWFPRCDSNVTSMPVRLMEYFFYEIMILHSQQ